MQVVSAGDVYFVIYWGTNFASCMSSKVRIKLYINSSLNLPVQRRKCRSEWPRGLRRRSAASRLLRLWVRAPPGAWMFFCRDCRVLSGRGLFDGPITRPEESYRMWCDVLYDLQISWMRRPWPTLGCRARNKQIKKEITPQM